MLLAVPGPVFTVLDFDRPGFRLRGKRGRREAGAVLFPGCLPSHRVRTLEPFCARAANHKQSVIINSVCSFSVHGRTEQLASACDLAPAGVSISNTTDRKRTVRDVYDYVFIFLTLVGSLVAGHSLTHTATSSDLATLP